MESKGFVVLDDRYKIVSYEGVRQFTKDGATHVAQSLCSRWGKEYHVMEMMYVESWNVKDSD